MRGEVLAVILYVQCGHCMLWPKGVVHYAISNKDYDMHSQDEIQSALTQIEREICVKFFHTPYNASGSPHQRVLYISNPDKLKTCPQNTYDYSLSVIDMPIGYKCLNRKDIARIVVDMLKASIDPTQTPINSYDLIKTFQNQDEDPSRRGPLAPADRNYINAHYHRECGALAAPGAPPSRRLGDDQDGYMSEATQKYYADKVWPLGVVMYSVDKSLEPSAVELLRLKRAMATIESSSCVVFQHYAAGDAVLEPKNLLLFGRGGKESPAWGFTTGKQTLCLGQFVWGAIGHVAHAVGNLLRVLGVPMMSNSYDRDNYVTINWKHVQKGKEHLLEKIPEVAWIRVGYDFASATHAPVNFVCDDSCALGAQTVQPVQDHLWQKTKLMGHQSVLSATDRQIINLLYGKECERRYTNKDLRNNDEQ